MTNQDQNKKMFYQILAWLCLFVDAVCLFGFFNHVWDGSSVFQDFWSFRWVLSVVFIVLFFFASIYLFSFSETKHTESLVAPVTGSLFGAIGLCIYIYFTWRHIKEPVTKAQYMGFIMLFLIFMFLSHYCLYLLSRIGYLEYGVAMVALLTAFLIMYKYVFKAPTVQALPFLGDLFLVVIGAGVFVYIKFQERLLAEVQAEDAPMNQSRNNYLK